MWASTVLQVCRVRHVPSCVVQQAGDGFAWLRGGRNGAVVGGSAVSDGAAWTVCLYWCRGGVGCGSAALEARLRHRRRRVRGSCVQSG